MRLLPCRPRNRQRRCSSTRQSAMIGILAILALYCHNPSNRRPARVVHGIRIAMSEVVLHGAQVDAGVGEIVAARVPQHIGVHALQLGSLPCHAHQIVYGASRHRLPTFRNEKPWQIVGARCKVALDRAQLVAGDRRQERVLQSSNPHTSLRGGKGIVTWKRAD